MRDIDKQKQLDRLLVEQSSALLEAAKNGGKRERQALADWLGQSQRHLHTYLFMAALDEELKHIDPERAIAVPNVLAGGATPTLVQFPSPTQSPARRTPPWKWLAAALVLIALSTPIALTLQQRYGGWQQLATAAGEQRAVQLKDGSIVQLNTRSRVQTKITAEAREIRLLEGEAYFKVAKDPSRPFKVHTSDATIVAVGTQFNVYQQDGQTKVSVLEGRVKVSPRDQDSASPPSPAAEVATSSKAGSAKAPPSAQTDATLLLAAGDEAEVRRGSAVERREVADVNASAAWVQRRLVFKQEPLANVVLQFNRYRDKPQFVVEDSELATRKYSGMFDVDDPQSLEDVLASQRDVIIDTQDDIVTIRKRR